jgi:phosphatidylglycerophosphatase C
MPQAWSLNQTAMKETSQQAGSEGQTSAPSETRSSRLVLFDFDGTITSKDTLIEFVHFLHGRKKYLLGMVRLAPYLALYALKLIPNWKAKQYFLSQYFKGTRIDDFDERCAAFSTQVLPSLIRPLARKAIEAHRREKATIVVVSASAENWVKPWCDENDIHCLATKLEIKQGIITGKINGRNCYGDEKVCRIKEQFDLSDFNEVIAYGDSSGDKEMLALADKKYFKPFRD